MMTIRLATVDSLGNVKRLNNESIVFEVQGEGRIIGDASNGANPARVEWGSVPVIIRSTTTPGEIRVIARVKHEGPGAPIMGEIEFQSVPADVTMLYSETPALVERTKLDLSSESERIYELKKELGKVQQELNTIRLQEVRRAQEASPAYQ